ncbi:MAG: hypothetical protein IJ252_02880 [Solobacterium sp.]|nr:hypothetical protein [Solobacterium sp.]
MGGGNFTDNEEIIALGKRFILGSVLSAPVYGLYQMCSTYLQATGKVTAATFVSLLPAPGHCADSGALPHGASVRIKRTHLHIICDRSDCFRNCGNAVCPRRKTASAETCRSGRGLIPPEFTNAKAAVTGGFLIPVRISGIKSYSICITRLESL